MEKNIRGKKKPPVSYTTKYSFTSVSFLEATWSLRASRALALTPQPPRPPPPLLQQSPLQQHIPGICCITKLATIEDDRGAGKRNRFNDGLFFFCFRSGSGSVVLVCQQFFLKLRPFFFSKDSSGVTAWMRPSHSLGKLRSKMPRLFERQRRHHNKLRQRESPQSFVVGHYLPTASV